MGTPLSKIMVFCPSFALNGVVFQLRILQRQEGDKKFTRLVGNSRKGVVHYDETEIINSHVGLIGFVVGD